MERKKKLVSMTVLARHLGVERQNVNNWVARGIIKGIKSKDVGITLVEKINKIPTENKKKVN